MNTPILYRKRFIPNECIQLKDDIILECDEDHLITKWSFLHERCDDLSRGYSCCYLNRGFRISKFLRADGSLKCWYCDILTYEHIPSENKLIMVDLLADVVIYPDGRIKVVDLDELSDAFEKRLIDEPLLKKSLLSLSKLLDEIYSKGIDDLIAPIEKYFPE
jgi:protein associated with RNAse G/E